MNQTEYSVSDELDIRHLFSVLWRKKVLIAVIVVAAILISTVLSVFILPKEYNATATYSVTPQTISASALSEKITIDDPFSRISSYSQEEYLDKMNSPEVLQAVIDTLNLDLSVAEMDQAITLTVVEKTALVRVSVVYSNPGTAQDIANTLGTVFEKIIDDVRAVQILDATGFADEKIDEAKERIDEIGAEKESFLAEHDVESMLLTQDIITPSISKNEKRLIELEAMISADAAFVVSMEEVYPDLQGVSAENLSIFTSPNMITGINRVRISMDVVKEDLSEALLIFSYVSTQMELLEEISEQDTIIAQNALLEDELSAIEDELSEYLDTYNQMNEELALENSKLSAYSQRKTELETLAGEEAGASVISLSSGAVAGDQPDSPNVLRNVLLSAVLGLMLGVCVVYVKEIWWKKPDTSGK